VVGVLVGPTKVWFAVLVDPRLCGLQYWLTHDCVVGVLVEPTNVWVAVLVEPTNVWVAVLVDPGLCGWSTG